MYKFEITLTETQIMLLLLFLNWMTFTLVVRLLKKSNPNMLIIIPSLLVTGWVLSTIIAFWLYEITKKIDPNQITGIVFIFIGLELLYVGLDSYDGKILSYKITSFLFLLLSSLIITTGLCFSFMFVKL